MIVQTKPHIANIVFDIGNVLYAYDPSRLVRIILGNTPHHDLFLEHLFHAPLWQALDRGDLSEDAALAHLATCVSDPEFVDGCRQLLTRFSCELEPIPETHTALRDFARQYPVYLLTNFQSQPFQQLLEKSNLLRLARGAIVSADEKCMKPEPRIYDLLLERFSLIPEETLFIDDMPENVAAARKKGIHAVLFSPGTLLKAVSGFNLKGTL